MKKTNLLVSFLAMFFGLSLVFSSEYILAQNSKEVKVKIVQSINGTTKTIEKTFSADDEESLEELLKEYDLNIDADEVLKDQQVEISIRKFDNDADDKEVRVNINGSDPDGNVPSKAFIGVFVEDIGDYDVDDSQKPEKGVVISGVMPETPAEKVGLQEGDIITKVNDIEITGREHFRETIRSYKPGDEVNITYLRDGKLNNVSATLEEKKGDHPFPMFRGQDFDWNGQLPPMHFHFPDDMKDLPFLGIVPDDSAENKDGVRMGDVIEKSTAKEIGLKKGDVITSINDKPVKTFDELREVIRNMNPGDDVKVKYQREGKAGEASGTLKSKADSDAMCFKWDGKMPPCYDRFMHDLGRGWSEDKGITKEGLARKIDRLEEELQELKEQLNQLNNTGSYNDAEKKANETKVTITIEDVSKNNLNAENLFFSPNPSNGKFNLSFELPEKGKTNVKIFDVNNKEIFSESLGKFSGRYEKQIDVSENPKGIYFLQITQDNKVLNKKIAIQ